MIINFQSDLDNALKVADLLKAQQDINHQSQLLNDADKYLNQAQEIIQLLKVFKIIK